MAIQLELNGDRHAAGEGSGSAIPPNFMFRLVRTRLLEELQQDASQWLKILSVIAPTGYGKTVLMSELFTHLHQSGESCYWVRLDHRHKSVERVLYSVRLALSAHEADLHATRALFRGDEPIETRVDELIDFIARIPAPSTIFIDNLNSCIDEALGAVLDALIFRTPSSVRFVWSSTTALAINLGRARLEGLIRQVGFSELSLNADETRKLLGTDLDRQIGSSGLEAILRQTEGWPAAIRMAQIILAESDQPQAALEAFSGSDEDVSALLNRQVLKGFPPELRDFLLALAQLSTFSVKLCSYATGFDDAESHLEFLLRRNVFIIPLDRNRKRYRLHGLFREYLLSEAERTVNSEKQREILKRAAVWCEQSEDWQDAIDYALAAGEVTMASRMLDRTAKSFVRESGDIQQYIHWVERLQTESFEVGWEAHYWYVWALIYQRHFEYGLQQHKRLAERFHRRQDTDTPPDDFLQRIGYLRICLDLFMDRLNDAYRGTERWLSDKQSNDPFSVGSVLCIKSSCLASSFDFAQAQQTMRTAQPILLEMGGAYTVGWISLINGTISVYQGDYAHGYREVLAGLSRARGKLGEDAVLCGTMAFVGAKCAVEMGLQDEARNLLIVGMRTAQNIVQVDTAACGLDAAIKLWNGGSDELVSIARLREVAGGYPPRLSLMMSCYLIQRLLCLGHLGDALAEGERIGLSLERGMFAEPATEELAIARYRDLITATAIELLIATRQFKRAEALIAREVPVAREEGRIARLVDFGLAKVAIAMHMNNPSLAAKELTIAASRAARRRIVRPFHDRAEIVASLVADSKPSAWLFALTEEREFFAEICRGLPINGHLLIDWSATWGADRGLQVALTKREAELLSCLDAGWSNQQIADHNNVSITTIKWHLQNLYRKFCVSSRHAALARARTLRLISK